MSLFSAKIWRAGTTGGREEIHVEDGALIEVESGGMFAMPVQTVSSTATVLKNYGVSIVKTTVSSSGNRTNTMTAPTRPGLLKIINFTIKNSTKYNQVDCGSGITVVAQTTETAGRYLRHLQLANKQTYCQLVSLTTAKWLLMAKTTNISVSTAATT